MATSDLTFGPEDGKRLPCRERQDRAEYHERASGLRLRVTRNGARTWLVAYWSPTAKTARRLKLGDASEMSLKTARAAARNALHAVEKQGRDPYAERVTRRDEEREHRRRRGEERRKAADERGRRSVTFGKLCNEYIEYRRTAPSGRYNRTARPNTLLAWDSMLRLHVLPVIGDRPPEDLTSEHFVHVLEGAVRRGGLSMGPRVREFLSAVWRWIEQRPRALGIRLPQVSPLVGLPKVGVAQKDRDRTLAPTEIWRLWRASEREGLEGEALRFMLLTAARVKEATALQWSEVDLEAGLWRLPANRNKSGRDRAIPLSDQAVAVIRRARAVLPDSANVFGAAQARVGEAVDRIREAMGGEHWEPRDLRRTSATLCARLGADPFTVALVLGHAKPDARMPDITRTYLRWDYPDKVRDLLARLGEWVAETVRRETEPGEVVAFPKDQRA